MSWPVGPFAGYFDVVDSSVGRSRRRRVPDSGVATKRVALRGAGSLGTAAGKRACLDLVSRLEALAVLGVGNGGGTSHAETKVVRDLADVLQECVECRRRGSPPRAGGCASSTPTGQQSAAEVSLVRIAAERGATNFEAFLDAQVPFHLLHHVMCVFVFGLCYRVN